MPHINVLLILHLVISLLIATLAMKRFKKDFLTWFIISLILPVISLLVLLITGYDKTTCPNCHKIIRKSADTCPYCGFNMKEYNRKHDEFVHFAEEVYRDKKKEKIEKEKIEKDKEIKVEKEKEKSAKEKRKNN